MVSVYGGSTPAGGGSVTSNGTGGGSAPPCATLACGNAMPAAASCGGRT
jgi:hypothetical protein